MGQIEGRVVREQQSGWLEEEGAGSLRRRQRVVVIEGFPVRLFAFKVKMEASRFRYGALEVSLGFWSGEEWISGCIHSKLVSKSWPSMSKLRKKTESFICEIVITYVCLVRREIVKLIEEVRPTAR